MKTPTGKLVGVLKDFLEAIVFPSKYNDADCPFAGQKMFDAVKVFDMADMVAAFQELLVFKNRAAFIVLTQETQRSKVSGSNLEVSFQDEFAVMLSDRSYKNRQIAMLGDSTTPGVFMLSDILVQAIAGELKTGFVCVPNGGDIFALEGKERENEIGRIGWRQDVVLHGGRIVKPLSRLAQTTYAP